MTRTFQLTEKENAVADQVITYTKFLFGETSIRDVEFRFAKGLPGVSQYVVTQVIYLHDDATRIKKDITDYDSW